MALNESLRFQDATPAVKRAFTRTPEKILLEAHVGLYKWTNSPLRVSEERAHRLKKSHREFSRVRAAISGEFGNSMKELLVIQLNEPVWAFAGQASGQPEFAKNRPDLSNVLFIGGAHQVWLPNLTPQHITVVPVRG